MNKAKNILLIIPNLDFGGAQETFSKLSDAFGKYHNVYNVVFNRDKIAEYKLGGELIDLNIPSSTDFFSKSINFFRRFFRVKKIKERYQIDVSISFLEGADYVNILSKKKERVIISIRGSKHYDQNISGVLGFLRHKILIPFLYSRADEIVALNNGVSQEIRDKYSIRKRAHIIYNGFDVDRIQKKSFEQVDASEARIFTKPVIVSHGRLAIEKGYDFLLQVFAKLYKQTEVRLLLIGDGLEKKNLTALCRDLDIKYSDVMESEKISDDSSVIFLGYKSNPFKYLRRSTIFILSSRHEGFGNSLLEAMICGLPVVSSDCPYGPREILCPTDQIDSSKGCGLLLSQPADDQIDHWAVNLALLLGDSKLQTEYKEQSTKRISDFALDNMINSWLKLLDNES